MFNRGMKALRELSQTGAMSGLVLAMAALAALVVSNSPWSGAYEQLLHVRGEVRIGDWITLSKPLLIWINDLWMAVFFFLVGLEIKRELLVGDLSSVRQALLPAGAALGGMAVPALIYALVNAGDAAAMRGWAIPTATDIAFALGVLALLGSRVPPSLKVFLTAVAIIDDLGAIVIIAVFYTENLSLTMLGGAAVGAVVLTALNRARVMNIGPYVLVGLVIWVFVLKSGVHATLAGVVTAMAIPLSDGHGGSPLRRAEHDLHGWVNYLVLPVFAFVNAGVSFAGMDAAALLSDIPVGIAVGLLVGKTIGVFCASGLLIRLAGASLPQGASWMQFLGVCVLCGIGFTMSLFIGSLAFDGLGADYESRLKLGVLAGSLVSGLVGTAVLLSARRHARSAG